MSFQKNNQRGFAHVEVLVAVFVVVLVGLAGWYVYSKRGSNDKNDTVSSSKQTKTTSKSTEKKAVTLDEKDVAQLKETPTKTTPATATSSPSKQTTNTSTSPAATPTPAPTTTPSYSITISSDGCSVSAYSVPGNHIEIGAFSNTKGGSVMYDITSNQTITKSSGGIKGMTAFGRTTDANGTVLAYHSAIITADTCPAAG